MVWLEQGSSLEHLQMALLVLLVWYPKVYVKDVVISIPYSSSYDFSRYYVSANSQTVQPLAYEILSQKANQ